MIEEEKEAGETGTEAFENDSNFFRNGYNADQHLGDQAILSILKNVRPASPPAYHVARAFTKHAETFFHHENVFPLRSFIKNRKDKDDYIQNLATGDWMAYTHYIADCRAQTNKGKKKVEPVVTQATEDEDAEETKKKKIPPVKQLNKRYDSWPSHDRVRMGADEADWQYLTHYFTQRVDRNERYRVQQKTDLINNVDSLSKNLGLDPIDHGIFKYVIAFQRDTRFSKLLKDITVNEATQMAIAARSLGIDKAEFIKRTGVTSELSRKGLIKGKEENEWPTLNEGVYTILKRSTGETSDYVSKICGEPCTAELSIDDYPHLAEDVLKAKALLKDALDNKKKGVNILIWGPVGTGKTKLAEVLGNDVAKRFYRVGEKDGGKHEILTRKQRFEAVSLAQAMLKGSNDVVLSLDEMEDFLQTSEEASPQGKAHFNRVLEENPVPVIWTVNKIDKFDPAVLRRFTWNIFAPPPPSDVRTKMYKRIAERMGREMTDQDAAAMGKKYSVPPALIQKAFDADKALAGDKSNTKVVKENLIASLENSAQVLYGMKSAFEQQVVGNKPYDLSLANASVANMPYSLDIVSKKLKGSKANITMMLFGEPGTGKTGFANYFAQDVLDKEILIKEYSSISSMWVGEAEKNIAAAFDEAYYEKKVLVLNEADSLLRDRSFAKAQWEVTQVNEMLTQMEKTKVPVMVTTNLVKNLDPASIRRFMFQIKFDTLRPEQVVQCYKTFFDRDLPEKNRILNLGLAPGDFASVSDVYEAFGRNMDDEELQSFLHSKVKDRSDRPERIGFNPQPR